MKGMRAHGVTGVGVAACALSAVIGPAYGQRVEIWDNGPPSMWTRTLSNGDPIDTGGREYAKEPQLAVDSGGAVYAVYEQSRYDYLSRCNGTDVRIWDRDTASWTKTFADGDPIGRGATGAGFPPRIAVDSSGVVYVAYEQWDGWNWHIHLSRYDGRDLRVWDRDTASWTARLADGDPIDTGVAHDAFDPHIAVEPGGAVYVGFSQHDGDYYHVYLSRYDGRDVRIWDRDAASWTAALEDGDPIDRGIWDHAGMTDLAVDSNGIAYAALGQGDGNDRSHILLYRSDGRDVRVWDRDTTSWTAQFEDGDPVDTGTAIDAYDARIAIDSNTIVYMAYAQDDGARERIYMSRYDGGDVRAWDRDTASWTATLEDGDPISTDAGSYSGNARIALDPFDNVYVAYEQARHIYLGRYDGTAVRAWDRDAGSWPATLEDGDPIDGDLTDYYRVAAHNPRIAVDSRGNVYVAYEKHSPSGHVYMSRYNGADVRIWDGDTSSWTGTFAKGDPIDKGGAYSAGSPEIAIDSSDRVYVAFDQTDNVNQWHVYLCRYVGPAVVPARIPIPRALPIWLPDIWQDEFKPPRKRPGPLPYSVETVPSGALVIRVGQT